MTLVVNQQFQLIGRATDVQLAGQLYDSLLLFDAIKFAKNVNVRLFPVNKYSEFYFSVFLHRELKLAGNLKYKLPS